MKLLLPEAFTTKGNVVNETKTNWEKRLITDDITEKPYKKLNKTSKNITKFTLANTNCRTQGKINVKCRSYVTNSLNNII